MLRNAIIARPPREAFARIAAFLAPCGAAGPVALPLPGLLRLPEAAEVPIRFGPAGRSFGLLCRPTRPRPGAPAVLLPASRDALGRLWPDLARELAAAGIASLRFDAPPGAGESEGEGAEADEEDGLILAYRPQRVAELRAALDVLQAEGHARIAAVGFCARAYTALLVALEDPRLVGLVLGNPFFLDQQRRVTRTVLSRLPGMPEAACATATAPSDPVAGPRWAPPPLRWRDRAGRMLLPTQLRRLLRRLGAEERAARRNLRQLAHRGCAVHFVFAAGDHGHIRLCRAFGETPHLPPGVTLSLIEDAGHLFAALRHRARFVAIARDDVLAHAGAAAPTTHRILEAAE
jgi:hypothetical protein